MIQLHPSFKLRQKLESSVRSFEGPLTSDLVLNPAKFGLGNVPARLMPDATTNVVCGYCSTGCGLKLHLKDGEAVNLSASPEYPVNLGMACPKGWESLAPLKADDRAVKPLLRQANGKFEPVSWDQAMRVFVDRIRGIQEKHGKESVAYLSTGQIVTEEMAFLGALTKFGMGILHGDANTRQCMATAAFAYKESFGFDAPPFTYKDFEESDVIVLVGSNLCIAHPIMWQRISQNRRNPKIVVIDPRKTETAMAATHYFAIKPKSDLVLLYTLAKFLIDKGWVDENFIQQSTSGFSEFREFLESYPLEEGSRLTGLPVEEIEEFARLIRHGKQRVSFWWTMGVNQSYEGVRVAQAIINLALMTGNIGKPGTGANSITGQCNAMGSRIFSNTTNLLGGHDFKNSDHRFKIACLLGIPEATIPRENSKTYDQILEAVDRGEIKGLWVIATNPAHSWINQDKAREVLEKLDFLVVQDMYHSTDTAQLADLILPAAGWGEKEGFFINSERRLGLCKKIAKAPGEALADFQIFRLIAHYWGCPEMFRHWSTPEDVFKILREISRGQPCDISGIEDYRMIDDFGGIQWPLPEGMDAPVQERRLFEDGRFFHADGRARFKFEAPRPMPEPVDREFPFLLITGRSSSSQWHTETKTGKSPVLRKLAPRELQLEIHSEDADELGIENGGWVTVASRRASIQVKVSTTGSLQRGQAYLPMHSVLVNKLTHPAVDPYSRQPSYKACAIRIEPADGRKRKGLSLSSQKRTNISDL